MTKPILKLTHDSRDEQFFQRFGGVTEFPDEINFDTDFPDETQPLGDVKCVAYTTCDMAEDQQNIEFDISSINDLWQRVPSVAQGSNPRDVLSEAVKNGLLPKGRTERLKLWRSYWRADIGPGDKFDNVRSAMLTIKQPVGVGSYWYSEWTGEILPIGRNALYGHMYDVEGWKQINGEPHFIIQAWTGRKLYMSREVFNKAMEPYGMQTWVLSTAELDAKRVKTLTETIKDMLINIIIKLKEFKFILEKQIIVETPQLPPTPSVPPIPTSSKLTEFCEAIKTYEGYFPGSRSYLNNNPGNLRFTAYTESLGATSKDAKNFCIFPSYAIGFEALKQFIRDAGNNLLKSYHDKDILGFFAVYAPSSDSNNPNAYAIFVASKLKVATSTKLKDII